MCTHRLLFLLVIDFEATCESSNPDNYRHEIIEFPVVVVDCETKSIVSIGIISIDCEFMSYWIRYIWDSVIVIRGWIVKFGIELVSMVTSTLYRNQDSSSGGSAIRCGIR